MKKHNMNISKNTDQKHKYFQEIVKTVLEKFDGDEFTYIDTHAGVGHIDNYTGSPIIFIREAFHYQNIYFKMVFCDKDKNTLQILNSHKGLIDALFIDSNHKFLISTSPDCNYVLDNLQIKGLQGFIFCDPNGNIPPFKHLARFEHFDILINVKITSIKRMLGKTNSCGVVRLSEYMTMVNKKYWFIKDQIDRCQQNPFILLFATNNNYGNIPNMHDIRTEKGSVILTKHDLLKKELKK